MMKKFTLILLSVLMVFVLAACGGAKDKPPTEEKKAASTQEKADPKPAAENASAQKEFTLEDLKAYDGKEGRKAYVAVDGVVYDLTDVPKWKGGTHNGIEAGQDVTQAIKEKSPHGLAKLEGKPVVGKLVK